MHRVRDRLVARRTSVINQLRAFLLERGTVFAKTPFKLKQALPEILENADANLTPRMRMPRITGKPHLTACLFLLLLGGMDSRMEGYFRRREGRLGLFHS